MNSLASLPVVGLGPPDMCSVSLRVLGHILNKLKSSSWREKHSCTEDSAASQGIGKETNWIRGTSNPRHHIYVSTGLWDPDTASDRESRSERSADPGE
ncbi:hypothetical protein EYF80_018103 [Liparis tanakae]|uniref:Uncharacterized protein n=1 Tax=Liparis tanakae TaxID=230148 RepID=A0A4Z2I3B8_9TELE|nr:hypothetical protein EYF80_018103 [Liparis tanakae]